VSPEAWVATYAAIVATGALFLEIRRWFESGVRLVVRVTPDMMTMGSANPEHDEKDLVAVTVYNRGEVPTTLVGLSVLRYPTLLSYMRNRPSRAFVIPNPQLLGHPPNLPSESKAGSQWSGFVRHRPDVIKDLQDGTFYVAVTSTDRDKPYLVRIPKRKRKPT
jgi:hypothetical protein